MELNCTIYNFISLILSDNNFNKVKEYLRAYFESKSYDLLRVIIADDVGSNTNLIQINNVFNDLDCGKVISIDSEFVVSLECMPDVPDNSSLYYIEIETHDPVPHSKLYYTGSRPENIPDDGLLCDLMWADPEKGQRDNYEFNSSRGVGVTGE